MGDQSERRKDALIVAPWLQGGGAQAALLGVLDQIDTSQVDLVLLFQGSRNFGEVAGRVRNVIEINAKRSALGTVIAARRLRPLLSRYGSVYSLLRAGHVVLGIDPRALRGIRLAATFHQLPSSDRQSAVARVEEVLIRRALRNATLVTAPSSRALAEVQQFRLAPSEVLAFEDNVIRVSNSAAAPAQRSDGTVKLAAIGRLAAQKGFDRLPTLLADTGDTIELRIIGDGEEAGSLAELDWPAHVHAQMIGRVGDIRPHLDWCDAVIMPSRSELNPVVVWEAWSRGRLVLASDLPVFKDLTTQGPLSLFSSPQELAARLESASLAAAQNRALTEGPRSMSEKKPDGHIADFFRAG